MAITVKRSLLITQSLKDLSFGDKSLRLCVDDNESFTVSVVLLSIM